MGDDRVSFTEQDLKEVWAGCINNIDSFMRSFLTEAKPVSFENYCLQVEAAPFVINRFSEPERQELLNRLIVEHTGIPNATVCFVPRSSMNSNETKHSSALPSVFIETPNTQEENKAILAQFSSGIAAKDTKNELTAESTATSVSSSSKKPIAEQMNMPTAPANIKYVIPSRDYSSSNLKRNLTFDTYVRGDNNDLAVGTAIAVAQNPGNNYTNPVFFYSGVGLGKTHLMHAIGNEIIKNYPDKRVLYTSAIDFLNDFLLHLHDNSKSMAEFRSKWRNDIDVLLIDDMQFMIDKDSTQDEFFHTFESLRDQNKQIVISSDRPPEQLPKITDRLCSRMKQGMVVDIQAPKLETRIAILHKKAEQNNYHLSDDILTYIAESSYYANVRELEGALIRVILYLTNSKKEPTLENAKEALKTLQTQNNEPNPEAILKAVCEYFQVTENNLTGTKRDQGIVKPRQIAMYLMREHTGLSLVAIGKKFGRNHTTVMHSCEWVENNIKDSYVKNSLTNLRDILKIK
ncbi:MAG: chromosomal replication initiator protein DnaA [bacterium]|nr:chromosomal replication initiator protein DnaA [bacterium]